MEMEVVRLSGDALAACLDDVARLRVAVFREFPYLYAGDVDFERRYLAGYAASPRAVVAVARRGPEVVGAATGLPLTDADPAFRLPYEEAGERLEDWFYFGESVLRADCRGFGVGHRFFDERESHARGLGFRRFTFCAVRRPEGHPLQPAGYRRHDEFWAGRGYHEAPGRVARLAWPQVDSGGREVLNELAFRERRELPQM